MQAQKDAIQTRVAECIALAEKKFGVKMPSVQVRFDLTGRASGVAGYRNSYTVGPTDFYLRFNIKQMQMGGKTWEHLLNDTVPHEVAHTVCQAFPKMGNNHNDGWKRVCVALGGNGRRTYSEADAPEAVASQRPYVYITTTGNEVRVTKVMHTKIQRGNSYVFKHGKGKVNSVCQYNYMSAPATKAAAKPVVVKQPTTKEVPVSTLLPLDKGSNAEQLRAYLRTAKAEVGSHAAEHTVTWAVFTLNMKPALARTYVKNNWNKV